MSKAAAHDEAVKIITLNIQHGGGRRVRPIIEYVAESKAHVVVLTEFQENANAKALRKELPSLGFEFISAATTSERQNSVCIASRMPFEARTYPELTALHQQRVISARFPGLVVYGVYFPQQEAKAAVFDFFLNDALSPTKEPRLVIGDFNTGLHKLDETGATFHCADRMDAMTTKGYVDSWRSRYPEKREFSWYSSAGNGFRIDHAFTSPDVDARIRNIRYDHMPRETSFTDHSALVVELDA